MSVQEPGRGRGGLAVTPQPEPHPRGFQALSSAFLQVAFRWWVSLLLSYLLEGPPSARNHGFWEQEQLGHQVESCPRAPWKPAEEAGAEQEWSGLRPGEKGLH